MSLEKIRDTLVHTLSRDVLQEISDKMHVLHTFQRSDGKGLSGGLLMESLLQEFFRKHLETDYHDCNEGQSDMCIRDQKISFKKIFGKSALAVNWSKNNDPEKKICQFDVPIMIMNLREGKWWKTKDNFQRLIPSGFFLISAEYCNTHVCFAKNNKTDYLIQPETIYAMLVNAMENNLFVELPPPRTGKYKFTIHDGFVEDAPDMKKWHKDTNDDHNGRRYIDLFCGVGGFHQALSSLGMECVFACDIDEECRENYFRNYGIMPEKDIRNVSNEIIPQFDILCAGFPCQPFSKAGDQNGFLDKTKGTLWDEIIRIAGTHKPMYLILENVANITSHDQGETWKKMRQDLISLGYTVHDRPVIISPLHCGTPQNRDRAIILGMKRDSDEAALPPFPDLKKEITSLDRILDHDGTDKYRLHDKYDTAGRIWEAFCGLMRENSVDIPRFPLWTDHWDVDPDIGSAFYEKYKNWIDKNRAFYLKHETILQEWLVTSRENEFWKGAVRKLEWQCDKKSLRECLWTFRSSGLRIKNIDYSPTLVATSNIPVYGPEWRYLTPREVCRLQDFPDTYIMSPKDRVCYRQMGNAVNVKVIKRVAEWLFSHQPDM